MDALLPLLKAVILKRSCKSGIVNKYSTVLRQNPDEYKLAMKPINSKCLRKANIKNHCLTQSNKVRKHLGIKVMLRLNQTKFFCRMIPQEVI